jgi:xylulokinase
MGFNVLKKSWDRSLLDHIGVDPDMLSFPVPDGTLAGVSNQFGLCNTKIISAMHDQNAAAIGAGALRAGDAVNGSGSVECLTPVVSELPDDGSACKAGIAFLPYVDGLYVGCAFSYTGGTALKWFHDNLGAGESYSELDSRIGNNPGEILLLPHFAGAATPYMDPGSKAMFWGITLGTTKYDLYRAVMEGVAYEMRINLDLLAECGIKPARLLATGGGAKSKIWTQIKSDVTGLPITIIDANEVGAVGVIMTCARTLGLVGSLDEAAEIYVKESETLYPNEKNRIYYSSMYEKYKKMYQLTLELR